MKSKIKGIPLALLGILGSFALIVVVPMVLLHSENQTDFARVENNQAENTRLLRLLLVTPSVTATPSASPTPSKAVFPTRSVTRPTATPTSGQVQ